ncbi:FIG01230870: hypothetical protein [hydrothermal vent metagenome]|uniref:BioF2-like acetyltransferase domain-containing protein n=1 Tax=hydrothermal vent metagenome TaxID=652676 RepID=A0A3B0Y3V6_9ZZZZ
MGWQATLSLNSARHSFNGADNAGVLEYISDFSGSAELLISNIETRVEVLRNEVDLFPLTVNNTEYNSCYVCSPYTALISYSLEEIDKVDNRLFRVIARCLIPKLSSYLKRNRINQIVSINNWLLSTNLYGGYSGKGLSDFTADLIKKYPEHALMFRSLNNHSNKELINSLHQCGYIMMPSRQVYIFDQAHKEFNKTQNYNYDCKLLNSTPLTYVPQQSIQEADIKRIVELYNLLYIKKYSVHNPMFTEEYIRCCLNSPLFYAEGFRNSAGQLEAVGIRFIRDNTVTLPIVGYDTSLPQSLGLYRLVMISTIKWAYENNMIFNASSGAPHFKRLRGAVPYIEYSAIYCRHLSAQRQRMWRSIAWGLERLIVPVMKKYQL